LLVITIIITITIIIIFIYSNLNTITPPIDPSTFCVQADGLATASEDVLSRASEFDVHECLNFLDENLFLWQIVA
jgi:hypothetical protein